MHSPLQNGPHTKQMLLKFRVLKLLQLLQRLFVFRSNISDIAEYRWPRGDSFPRRLGQELT